MSETGSSEWAPPVNSRPEDNFPREQKPQLIEVPDWAKINNPESVEIREAVSDDPFSNGKEIVVERSPDKETGAPAYLESGWKIIDDQAMVETERGSGKWMAAVRVEKEIDGVPYNKIISLEKVYAFNPREVASAPEMVEKEPLSEAQEDIAEEAIEDAIGLHDPSEIDEQAHNYSSADIRAMREAAQRVSGLDEAPVNPYDALLDPNTPNIVEKETRPDVYTYLKEALPVVTRGDTEASRKYYDKFVTEENKQVSLGFLGEAVKADTKIAAILQEAGLKPSDMAAVDAIRENPDVRYAVAKRLTQKLDTLADRHPMDFGWRVADNSPNNLKVDPQTGKRMRSRIYAVSMALKMLGGEFSERNEAKDFERDQDDRVALGQHRHAATSTIMSYDA